MRESSKTHPQYKEDRLKYTRLTAWQSVPKHREFLKIVILTSYSKSFHTREFLSPWGAAAHRRISFGHSFKRRWEL